MGRLVHGSSVSVAVGYVVVGGRELAARLDDVRTRGSGRGSELASMSDNTSPEDGAQAAVTATARRSARVRAAAAAKPAPAASRGVKSVPTPVRVWASPPASRKCPAAAPARSKPATRSRTLNEEVLLVAQMYDVRDAASTRVRASRVVSKEAARARDDVALLDPRGIHG